MGLVRTKPAFGIPHPLWRFWRDRLLPRLRPVHRPVQPLHPVWRYEGAYILDPFYQNKSDIQPDTVHADTHGQSAPIFGLAYVLGIQLMPRIRNWKHLVLYRPTKDVHYQHIDSLFSATVDWDLIATHLPDMLRVG